jgi:hypothetical protein
VTEKRPFTPLHGENEGMLAAISENVVIRQGSHMRAFLLVKEADMHHEDIGVGAGSWSRRLSGKDDIEVAHSALTP